LHDGRDHVGRAVVRKGHHHVDDHCLQSLVANVIIPFRCVISEWSSERIDEHIFAVLTQIGVDEEEKDTGVEELGQEDAFRDCSQLLRASVMPHPHGESNDQLTKNSVDNDGQERHSIGENEKFELVISVALAYLFSVIPKGVLFVRFDLLLCLVTTEAL
jgi:hypothetical protein